ENNPLKPPKKNWFRLLEEPFKRLISRLLKIRYAFIILFLFLLGSSLWYAANYMKFELFPSSMADKIMVLIELPTGTSLRATSDKMKEVEEIILSLPKNELESFITRIGSQEIWQASGFPPGENENWAYMVINLTPFTERSRVADEIVENLRQQSDKLQGFDKITYAIEAGGPPVGKPITLRIVGTDDTMRRNLVDSVVTFLNSLNGVRDIVRNDILGKEQIEIKINYDRLSRLGLTVADVAQNVRIAYDGEVVTSVRYGDEDVDFRVLLQEKARKRPELLSELLIPNQRGRLIPLKEVARLETSPGPSNYYHYDEERAITVTADIIKGVITPLEVKTLLINNFDMDNGWSGMRFIIGGEAEETEKSMVSLFYAFSLAIIGVFFLLILLFNSPTQPIVVMAAIPFGIMGVIWAFALHGEALGFIAMLGIIGLVGVLVNDSLVLVVHINNLRHQKTDFSIRELVAQGTADRLRAVLLTTMTTVVGLLPLAYGIGGTDPYMAPMAMALGYGLLFATPITLILVPSLYMAGQDLQKINRGVRKIFNKGN
ncbi:MAG: efflux RND transporter permease subunit, partial [Candidatus Zixiibacteriota bacterium]